MCVCAVVTVCGSSVFRAFDCVCVCVCVCLSAQAKALEVVREQHHSWEVLVARDPKVAAEDKHAYTGFWWTQRGK